MKLDMLYYQNIPGPKRRIAHIAKFDVSHLVPVLCGTLLCKVHTLSF